MTQTHNASMQVYMPHLGKHIRCNYSIQTKHGELDLIVNEHGNTIEKNSAMYESVGANLTNVISTGTIQV